jgi:four helix bundle protein
VPEISDKYKSDKYNGDMNGYRQLVIWQLADKLARSVYRATGKFPREEIFGVISQLRRAALSVPLNIVEGYARDNKNEFRNFLRIALGSLAETGYLLVFSRDQQYLTESKYEELEQQRSECGRVLWKFYVSQK